MWGHIKHCFSKNVTDLLTVMKKKYLLYFVQDPHDSLEGYFSAILIKYLLLFLFFSFGKL